MSNLKPTVYGVGFDTGKYGFKKTYQRKHTKVHTTWKDMLFRCYSDKARDCYRGCSVDPKWHDFQEFAKWFVEKYREGFELDKDILIDGNTLYSEDTCCLIPKNLNLFKVHTKNKQYTGVTANKYGTYTAYCNDGKGKTVNLGTRSTRYSAFMLYKDYKESLAKTIAQDYMNIDGFDERVYNALINFKVEGATQ